MIDHKRASIGEGVGNFAEYKDLIKNDFPHAQNKNRNKDYRPELKNRPREEMRRSIDSEPR